MSLETTVPRTCDIRETLSKMFFWGRGRGRLSMEPYGRVYVAPLISFAEVLCVTLAAVTSGNTP